MTDDIVHANNIKGMIYMFIATLFFGISDAIGKYLAADLPLLQVAWLRTGIGLTLLLTFALLSNRISDLKTSKPGGD